jgi:hypothetical protein
VDGRYGGSEKPSLVFKPDLGRYQASQRAQNDQ